MTKLKSIEYDPEKTSENYKQIEESLKKNEWIQIKTKYEKQADIKLNLLPTGPGLIIKSGGTSEGAKYCIHPCKNLDLSAQATEQWLQAEGINSKDCLIFNPLPIQHMSGLMPWWRSRVWECEHIVLSPSLMRSPEALSVFCQPLFQRSDKHRLLSLVPTQLKRLINSHKGLTWLKSFDVIWVGGAVLSQELAKQAKEEGLKLSPCYGSTETAAMVTALSPELFLAGVKGCGNPLNDVKLSLAKNGVLKIKTSRLAYGYWRKDNLQKICNENGWWVSKDYASIRKKNELLQVEIHGRIDSAINSGGEIVFPEQLEARLMKEVKSSGLSIEHLLLVPIEEQMWGQRLVALIRWPKKTNLNHQQYELTVLSEAIKTWMPAEKPIYWYECKILEPSEAGKWERHFWKDWLTNEQNSYYMNSFR